MGLKKKLLHQYAANFLFYFLLQIRFHDDGLQHKLILRLMDLAVYSEEAVITRPNNSSRVFTGDSYTHIHTNTHTLHVTLEQKIQCG